jgi:hypothetical protein
MNPDKEHFQNLSSSYKEVSYLSSQIEDFDQKSLESSRLFFKKKSLENNKPSPIDVDVYAILSGISFENSFLNLINPLINSIKKILHSQEYYLVKPENLGVEYAVLKWPEDELNPTMLNEAKNAMMSSCIQNFKLKVFGIQFHTDGCIILKCADENMSIFKFRQHLKENTHNLPGKQSNWVHIPLGRILSPIGKECMTRLRKLIDEWDNILNYDIEIDAFHLVHEKKWYMENKEFLLTKSL